MALLFALLDGSSHILCPHLHAALTLWRHLEACIRHIFADVCLSAKALRLFEALERGPLNFTQIHTLFHRNLRSGELDSLCKELTGRIDLMPGTGNAKEIVVRRR